MQWQICVFPFSRRQIQHKNYKENKTKHKTRVHALSTDVNTVWQKKKQGTDLTINEWRRHLQILTAVARTRTWWCVSSSSRPEGSPPCRTLAEGSWRSDQPPCVWTSASYHQHHCPSCPQGTGVLVGSGSEMYSEGCSFDREHDRLTMSRSSRFPFCYPRNVLGWY